MNLEVKIEIRSIVQKKRDQLTNNSTHNYMVFVQGLNGNQIEHFVKEVVFHQLSNSPDSKLVKTKPPYLISGSAGSSFRLPIDIFFHGSDVDNKVRYSYFVCLPDKPVERALNVKTLTFLNAPQDFRERLLRGGAEIVNQSTNSTAAATRIKSEPVEITENQNESFRNETKADSKILENEQAADSENTSKENANKVVLCEAEPIEDADIQIVNPNQLPNTCTQSNDISEQNGSSVVIESIYSFDELLKENRVLKKENEALCDTFSKQEGEIATYAEKLPVLQDIFSAVSTELNQLKQEAEAHETEISSLKSAIESLKAKILRKDEIQQENTVQRPSKRQRKQSVSSSFASESFQSTPSISLELDSSTSILSRKLLPEDKGRTAVDKCKISGGSLEFSALNSNSNITHYKNQLKFSCENKGGGSDFSSLNVIGSDCAQTVRETSAPDILNSSRNKISSENLSIQNRPSACSSNESPWHLISSIGSSGNAPSFGHPSLPRKNASSVSSLPAENASILGEVPSSTGNISPFDKELQSIVQTTLQQAKSETIVSSSERENAEPFNFNSRERDPVKFELKSGDNLQRAVTLCMNIEQLPSLERRDVGPGYLNPQERDPATCDSQNSGQRELQIICENISDLEIRKCFKKELQHSNHEAKDAGKSDTVIHNIREPSMQHNLVTRQADKNIFEEVTLLEPSTTLSKLSNVNREGMDIVVPDSTTGQDYIPKEQCKKIHVEPNQLSVESDLQIIKHKKPGNVKRWIGHFIGKRDSSRSVLTIDLCQIETKEIPSISEEDEVQVFPSNQKDTVIPNSKKILTKENYVEENVLENMFEEVTQKQINSERQESLTKRGNLEDTNLNHEKGNKISSNCESICIEVNSSQNESAKYLFKKATQEYGKGEPPVNLNQLKKKPVVSNFVHLKNPPLKKRRSVFLLPIPEDNKRYCRAKQSLNECKQKTICSSNSNSVRHSGPNKQVCLPVKNSSDTVTVGIKTSSTISIQINTAPKNNSAVDSVDGNSCFTTDANKNQTARIIEKIDFKRHKRKIISSCSNTIRSIFKDIDDRLISDAKLRYYVRLLTEFLTDPTNSPNISALIFLIIRHLRGTAKNYLQAFTEDRANCIFLPSSESCIVSALFEIENKHEIYSQLKLIENILSTIHHLLIATKGTKQLNFTGFASLCRVFTEICKRKSDASRPLALCVEMLKVRHLYAPYLIASIAGVWREPFMLPSYRSEEAMILLGSISFAAGKRTKQMHDSIWLGSTELIQEYFSFPSLPDVNMAINVLKDRIISNCTQVKSEQEPWKLWMTTSAFAILAAHQPCDWTKKHLIEEYIIPNLSRFSGEEPNEKAFAVFCDLCADVDQVHNNITRSVLMKYRCLRPDKDTNFVHDWATVSLIKYSILARHTIRQNFLEWFEKNQEKLCVVKLRDMYLRRNMYYYKDLTSAEDVVIT